MVETPIKEKLRKEALENNLNLSEFCRQKIDSEDSYERLDRKINQILDIMNKLNSNKSNNKNKNKGKKKKK
jgi:hypothetical protein